MSDLCANCQKNPATLDWVGEGGALAWTHGFYVRWCEACAIRANIEHIEKRVAELPELRRKLAELEAPAPHGSR